MTVRELLSAMDQQQATLYAWLEQYEGSKELPLYSSVDVRDAGFKVAAIDTNLFPSGFNNLCEHGISDAVTAIRAAILDRITGCRHVLVVAEEHTRNQGYLEHLRVLERIIEQAGFRVTVARTAGEITADRRPCFAILNNDLSGGVPKVLGDLRVPVYPSMQAGWHARRKSQHFAHTADLMREFAARMQIDPWLLTSLWTVVDQVDVHRAADGERLADAGADLLRRIQAKYEEHGIGEKPFLFIKPDQGTYGMGVMALEDPAQLRRLSSRQRNKLYRGKGAQVVHRYLLQEGVPSVHKVEGRVGEICIYQIANQFVGGFYRVHGEKTSRENLNSKGMDFKTMCPRVARYGRCGVATDPNMFDVYRMIARIAGIAAHREIVHLEAAAQ